MLSLCIQWRHIRYPAIVLTLFLFALLHFCHPPNEKRKNVLSPSNSSEGKMTAEGGRFLFFRKYQNKKDHREHKKIRDVDRVMVFEKRGVQ